MEIPFLNYICIIIRKLGRNETFSHMTHKLDSKVFSIEQMYPGRDMGVASQERSLKENSACLGHEVLHARKNMKTPYSRLDFVLSWDSGNW